MVSGFDDGAGAKDDALDSALGDGRDQAPRFVDRHQRAETTHVDLHRAAFDRINPHGRPLDSRRRRLEPRQDDRHETNDEDAGYGEGIRRISSGALLTRVVECPFRASTPLGAGPTKTQQRRCPASVGSAIKIVCRAWLDVK